MFKILFRFIKHTAALKWWEGVGVRNSRNRVDNGKIKIWDFWQLTFPFFHSYFFLNAWNGPLEIPSTLFEDALEIGNWAQNFQTFFSNTVYLKPKITSKFDYYHPPTQPRESRDTAWNGQIWKVGTWLDSLLGDFWWQGVAWSSTG